MTAERCFSVLVKKWRNGLFSSKKALFLSIVILIFIFGLNAPQIFDGPYVVIRAKNNTLLFKMCLITDNFYIWAKVFVIHLFLLQLKLSLMFRMSISIFYIIDSYIHVLNNTIYIHFDCKWCFSLCYSFNQRIIYS